MTRNQLRCLADARAEINRRGLVCWGRTWSAERNGAEVYDRRTVQSLIDLGWLRTWAGGEVAHITEAGEEALRDALGEAA